jgi:DNA transposition AAA+ family ATPase
MNDDVEFLVTKEHRRFVEFCNACRRYHYIGICYGPPGVGKTLSSRVYANWHRIEPLLDAYAEGLLPEPPILNCRTVFYTPSVATTAHRLEKEVTLLRCRVSHLVDMMHHLVAGEVDFPLRFDTPDITELLIIDEADRLKTAGLEQMRDIFDRGHIGLIFVGMPGLEKRLARYPQLYSRVGFVHSFRPLCADEMRFILEHKWLQLGLTLNPDDFTDTEASAAVIRITAGNLRLVQRLFSQIERIMQINEMQTVTKEVVEAARECLVIGPL